MPTRASKSILFMLPAALTNSSITVIIAPLNALQDDIKDCCKRASIKCAK